MNSTPKVLQNLIDNFASLPGIGPKSAARLAFHILNMPNNKVEILSKSIKDTKEKIHFCNICANIGDENICMICKDLERSQEIIMIVEDVLDLLAFESTNEYKGLYHVLGGVISPINGVGPDELNIFSLKERLINVNEIIIATNPNLEGEATAMYLSSYLKNLKESIVITRIARGVPSGADLDYTDKYTLTRAILGRTSL